MHVVRRHSPWEFAKSRQNWVGKQGAGVNVKRKKKRRGSAINHEAPGNWEEGEF